MLNTSVIFVNTIYGIDSYKERRMGEERARWVLPNFLPVDTSLQDLLLALGHGHMLKNSMERQDPRTAQSREVKMDENGSTASSVAPFADLELKTE